MKSAMDYGLQSRFAEGVTQTYYPVTAPLSADFGSTVTSGTTVAYVLTTASSSMASGVVVADASSPAYNPEMVAKIQALRANRDDWEVVPAGREEFLAWLNA